MTERDTSTLDERLASTDPKIEVVETVRRGPSEWVVVALRNGDPTVQVVDTRALSCDCPRGNERASETKACVHLTHVLVSKSKPEGVIERTVMALTALYARVRDGLDPTSSVPSLDESRLAPDGGTAIVEPAPAEPWMGLEEWVSLAEHWYARQGFEPGDLDIRVDRVHEAISVRASGLDDPEFQRFAKLNREHPQIKWAENPDRNLVHREDVGEVFDP